MNWHYNCDFGMHFDLHVSREEEGLGAGLTHENLREMLMIIKPDWIQCDCKGHPGISAWPTKYGTMANGVVNDALRIHSDVCHELGIKLGMHYSGVIDTEACNQHPRWEAVGYKGKNGEAQGYCPDMKSVCPHSPYYDELMIPQMLELIENYDVDGFWVDGDCWGVRLCYCEKCITEFKEKFGIDAPCEYTDSNWQLWLDYHRHLFVDNVNKYTDAIHCKKPECLVVSNWMNTFGVPLSRHIHTDYISGDLSNNYGLKSAILEGHFLPNRNKDWDLMVWSFESPNTGLWTAKSVLGMTQECAYVLACGGASMIYDMPHRNGLLTPWHIKDFAKVSDFIHQRAKYLRHSQSVPQIAVIHNPKDYFEGTKDFVYCINIGEKFYKRYTGICSLLLENHYHFDILLPSMIKGKFSQYKTVIIPEVYDFDEDFLAELNDYISKGGNLIVSGINATKTFKDLLGVTGEEISHEKVLVQSKNEVTAFYNNFTKVSAVNAEIFRYIMKDQIIGKDETEYPSITLNKYKNGSVIGIYFNMFSDYGETHYPRSRKLFKEIMDLLNVGYIIDEVEAPPYVHINLRKCENKYIVNIVNTGKVGFSDTLLPCDIIEEIPCVDNLRFRIKLDNEPKNVMLCPTQVNITSYYENGFLYVQIRKFHIMESVIIDI